MSNIGEPEKEKLFKENGYRYNSETLCYVSRKAGKIFTRAYINDHVLNILQTNIHDFHEQTDWKIYCNPEQEKIVPNILLVHGEKPYPVQPSS